MTWQHYLKDTRDELLPRYVDLCEDVAGRCEELGFLLSEEKRARALGYHQSEATTVSGQERDASLATTDISVDILKLRGELEALKEERDLLRWVFDATQA